MRTGVWITDFQLDVYPQYKNYPHTIHRKSTAFLDKMWIKIKDSIRRTGSPLFLIKAVRRPLCWRIQLLDKNVYVGF